MFRFVAYKQYTWWIHNRLGKGVRKVIPSCALWSIRRQYPFEKNTYKSYEERKTDEDLRL